MGITPKRHPFYWIPTTWFAMGLPFVALSAASSIMYKNMGISDTQIAFWTSLIMLPWTIKPLWGPFLEMFKTRKFFVYITQMLTGILFFWQDYHFNSIIFLQHLLVYYQLSHSVVLPTILQLMVCI